jgi:transposase
VGVAMSFIRYKKREGRRYAYEVTAYWDKELKKSRQKVVYLGVADDDGVIQTPSTEKLQLDFGDTFLLNEFIKQKDIYSILAEVFSDCNELLPLIFYRLCSQSAMHNASTWASGNYASLISKKANLSSQSISRVLKHLGDERTQRMFFKQYLAKTNHADSAIIIDATSLPNNSHVGFNAWGYDDGGVGKQLRMLCVLDGKTKLPLFYRYLPGNMLDISTLQTTVAELSLMGVKISCALLDAGYFSETNVNELYEQKINFLTRMPKSRTIYKDLILQHSRDLESLKYATKYGERAIFIKCKAINLYGHKAYAYMVLDPIRKGKELQKLVMDHLAESEIEPINVAGCGVMVLVSSTKISPHDVVSSYYARQAVEQVFGFYKDDLQLLPLRAHSDETIRGYLFLLFITLIIFIELRTALDGKLTVEQALLITRNLKCKIFDDKIVVAELTKRQKETFTLCDVIVPKICGI